MLWRLAQGQGLIKDWTPLSQIAPVMAQAAIAAEDGAWVERRRGTDPAALADELLAATGG